MDKQRAVNTVTANDEYSKQLIKMYENWMGGDCFQGSNIKEEEIPTGQKQGGGTGAAFKSAIGELPAIEYDKATTIPTGKLLILTMVVKKTLNQMQILVNPLLLSRVQ